MPTSGRKMPRKDYLEERQHLAKYEQANYENYEKTILTLSSAFLAFSISFLALFRDRVQGFQEGGVVQFTPVLVFAWLLFAASVLAILLSFLVSAMALRREMHKLEEALLDYEALTRANLWTSLVYGLYIGAGGFFSIGVVLLILYCILNVSRF